jgi:hypothetical protein
LIVTGRIAHLHAEFTNSPAAAAKYLAQAISTSRVAAMKIHVPPEWHVPAVFHQRLGDAAGKQRVMSADGHLLLVLHEPPAPGAPERTARLFWRDPEGGWRSSTGSEGAAALRRHVAKFAERLDALERQWKDADSAADFFALLRALAPVHRTTRNLYAALQQARELAAADRNLINLRDQTGEIERSIELLHGDARNGLDYTIAHQAEQQAERTYDMGVAAHRLNILAAVFFPVATLSAVFGMNLAHGLESPGSATALFWCVLAIGLISGLLLAPIIARKPAPIRPVPSQEKGTGRW